MARRTKEEAEHTRQEILASALNLFYEKGFSRTTFDEIAKRINLTKGAVYWHFRNKADLLAEIIRQNFAARNEIQQAKKRAIMTMADLRQAVYEDALEIENNKSYCKFLFFVLMQMEWSEAILQRVSAQVKDIRSYPLQLFKETLTLLQKRGEINPNVNIEELASLSMYMWRGIMSSYISKADPMSLSQMMLRGFDLIMDGIKMESKTDD